MPKGFSDQPPAVDRAAFMTSGVAFDEAPTPTQRRPSKPSQTVRQTLDLDRDDYDALHDRIRTAARVAGVTSRQLNAQHVLRALVHRFVTDQAFADGIMLDDVLGSE